MKQILTSTTDAPNNSITERRRRCEASHRLEPLECGCADPETARHHRHHDDENLEAYVAAAMSLHDSEIIPAPNWPALRVMWRRGGPYREVAADIGDVWIGALR